MTEGEFDKSIFEKEGLKIDQERILTYSKLSCPFDCQYCFVEDMNYNQKKGVSYLSPEQIKLLEKLPEEINLIMLGCDTEFLQSKKNALEILEKLSNLHKDISIITKLSLPSDFIEKLRLIDDKLHSHGNFLTFSMSIPCFDSAKQWEPSVPDPLKRIETLKVAHENSLKTLVAIRPLIPSVTDKELEEIVGRTKDISDAYYSGPLYLKYLSHKILDKETLSHLKIKELQPHWMPEGNVYYKIEKEGQMETLENIVEKRGKLLFEGAAEAIKYLKDKGHEKY